MGVIAFIPVRGNSKSIPGKNIKSFCGRPLVYWNLSALQCSRYVDEIVLATDSPEIEAVVAGFGFSKLSIYRRSAENATDTASTESVMLEYLASPMGSEIADNDIFMLVQATSPFTGTADFDSALERYTAGGFDSMLSCVRHKRFMWNADGTTINYDYRNRPRRQDYEGLFLENGAFYINTAGSVRRDRNRLSGRIGICEMPEFTSIEIDEPDDWVIAEKLFTRHCLQSRGASAGARQIRLFLSDVDGVLTDAGMYYSESGDELKKFNTHDGMGFQLLRESGIKTGIITSESTQIVERRAAKLKVDFLYQARKDRDKLAAAMEIAETLGIAMDEVAYIGDDLNCINLLEKAGIAACPADALDRVKSIPNIIVLNKKGGGGVVREFAEHVLSHNLAFEKVL